MIAATEGEVGKERAKWSGNLEKSFQNDKYIYMQPFDGITRATKAYREVLHQVGKTK